MTDYPAYKTTLAEKTRTILTTFFEKAEGVIATEKENLTHLYIQESQNFNLPVRRLPEYPFSTQQAKNEMYELIHPTMAQIAEAVEVAKKTVDVSLGIPMGAEAFLTLQALELRTEIDKEETQALMDRFGSNYQYAAALCDVAGRKGITSITVPPLVKHCEDMDKMRDRLSGLLGHLPYSSSGLLSNAELCGGIVNDMIAGKVTMFGATL